MNKHGQPRPKFRRAVSPRAPEEPGLSEQEEFALKTSGFWQGAYQGWFATALEQTRSVFALASAGVGLSLTLLFGEKVQPMESWAPVWLLLSTVSFVVAACLTVAVFHFNKREIGKLVSNESSNVDEALVGRLDFTARLAFGSGLIFLVLSAVSQIWL